MDVLSTRPLAVTLLVITMSLALSACTPTWSRPATSIADFRRDNNACRNMNTRIVVISSASTRDYVGPVEYRRCMEEEGYTDGGPWQGHAGWSDE